VEHVTVQVDLSHTRRGDVELVLTSPSGMTSRLAEWHDDETEDYFWTFMSVRHWGENSTGTWKLRAVDRNGSFTGTLNAATITLYGTPAVAPTSAPVVWGPVTSNTAGAIVGVPFSLQLTATNAPTSFSATNLPAGLGLNTTTGLISGTPTTASAPNSSITATNGAGTSSAKTLTITVVAQSNLANAVDFPAARWLTGGNVLWARTTTAGQFHDGSDAAKPATMGVGQRSYLKAQVQGPAVVRFWWKIQSEEGSDYLDFLVDNELVDYDSGTVDWVQRTHFIPAGRQLLRWEMSRSDESSLASSTAVVDQVTVIDPNTLPPLILEQPQNVFAPEGGKTVLRVRAIGQAPLTYQWKRAGVNVSGGTSPELLIQPVPTGTAIYTCTVTNALGDEVSGNATLTVTAPATAALLANAMDTTQLGFGTNTSNGWFRQTSITQDGADALRSGAIGNNASSIIQTCITGPGTLAFYARTSSEEDFDFLDILMDGVLVSTETEQLSFSGLVDWAAYVIDIPPGHHVIEWNYNKDAQDVGNLDAGFLDQAVFIPTGYEAWRALQFTFAQQAAASVTGPSDDPDKDGISNLMEFALGMNPNVSSRTGLPTTVQNGAQLEFVWQEDLLYADDITYVPEISSDLIEWIPMIGTQVSTNDPLRTMKVSLSVTSGKQYIRLRVSQNSP
jgi:subtilisin-like proprotein convertase family protein